MSNLHLFRILPLLFFCSLATNAANLSPAEETAQMVRDNPRKYYYGEGSGTTLEEARTNALTALSQAIKSVVWTDIHGEENTMAATISVRTGISSFTTLANTEAIEFPYDEENQLYRVMQYMSRSELQRLGQERDEKIREWVKTGRAQESRLEISNALKYYYWALCLCDVHSASVKLDIDGKKTEAKPWIESKIRNLLNSIDVTLVNLEERPSDANPYVANVLFSIKGQPVNGLQFSYYTGLRRVDNIYAKNGNASLEFPRIPSDRIDIKYNYAFPDEAKLFDPELEAYFQANPVRNFKESDHKIPVSGTDVTSFTVKAEPKTVPVAAQTATSEPVVADVEIAPRRRLIKTEEAADPQQFLESMQKVEDAIISRDYSSVEQLFTPEGYARFMMMMNSGDVKVTRTKGVERRIEQAEGYIIAKPIPLQITYRKRHHCNENLVLRFTPDGKIGSVAYALTSRAEDDIFRQNMWDMKARYAMLTFMEDYQTAFALKDLDYIDKIFDSNAIIINAVVVPASRKSKRRSGDGYFVDSPAKPRVRYTKRSKEEYLDYLRKDFRNKQFIQLTFEENEIASQSGIKNSIYWIELKQNYASNTYCDVGYLTLMIDLDEFDPYILVRTWTPDKLDLRDMMNRYTQD